MNVRATRIVGDPAKADAAGTASYQAMVASMKQVDGFLGAVLLVDRTTGSSVGLTFWESERALRASEEVATKFRSEGASAIGATGTPTVERFEVAYYGAPQPSNVR
ncbi:MAG TPA: antibiotic biosynthesis monooxygenase [Candidatus Dormibacteraeota bacterium]|nr:antibiotic biosynthesis monooxygenase [Candidatus Dormibacteraeota bacterium]